ncbi:U2 [Hyposoter didymator ichnovirus]|nr:U2 [Hyposoter didymator ichnovirus]
MACLKGNVAMTFPLEIMHIFPKIRPHLSRSSEYVDIRATKITDYVIGGLPKKATTKRQRFCKYLNIHCARYERLTNKRVQYHRNDEYIRKGNSLSYEYHVTLIMRMLTYKWGYYP